MSKSHEIRGRLCAADPHLAPILPPVPDVHMISRSLLRAGRRVWCIALLQCGSASATAPDTPEPTLREVLVISAPLPDTTIDVDRILGNVRTLLAEDLGSSPTGELTDVLLGRVASVNLADNLGSEFQPDLLYRGFAASPVLGTPQGLAAYQNGVRVNEAFGDAVNWDLIPDIAIRRLDLVSANPIYGLNALGGGVVIRMKDRFSDRGADAVLSGGSFGQRSVTAQAGANDGRAGIYAAIRGLDRTGWRQHSSDRLRQMYLDASLHVGGLTADLSYTRADNALAGQGAGRCRPWRSIGHCRLPGRRESAIALISWP